MCLKAEVTINEKMVKHISIQKLTKGKTKAIG